MAGCVGQLNAHPCRTRRREWGQFSREHQQFGFSPKIPQQSITVQRQQYINATSITRINCINITILRHSCCTSWRVLTTLQRRPCRVSSFKVVLLTGLVELTYKAEPTITMTCITRVKSAQVCKELDDDSGIEFGEVDLRICLEAILTARCASEPRLI